jgi:hypothetical protein
MVTVWEAMPVCVCWVRGNGSKKTLCTVHLMLHEPKTAKKKSIKKLSTFESYDTLWLLFYTTFCFHGVDHCFVLSWLFYILILFLPKLPISPVKSSLILFSYSSTSDSVRYILLETLLLKPSTFLLNFGLNALYMCCAKSFFKFTEYNSGNSLCLFNFVLFKTLLFYSRFSLWLSLRWICFLDLIYSFFLICSFIFMDNIFQISSEKGYNTIFKSMDLYSQLIWLIAASV